MNNLFKNSLKFSAPYDHLICDDFLKDYDKFDKEYPTHFLEKSIRMDKDLTFGDKNYNQIYKSSFNKLHQYVYSPDFILDFLKIFDSEINQQVLNEELLFDPRGCEINPNPYELRNFISNKNIPDDNVFLFPRLDFGIGFVNYGKNNGGRGVHTDNVTRLVSIMLFFTDQEEVVDGQHQLFSINHEYTPVLEKTVKIKKNRLLASIQSNNAYHSVNPLKMGERKAIYMSISCSKKIWKDYEDPKLRFLSQNRR